SPPQLAPRGVEVIGAEAERPLRRRFRPPLCPGKIPRFFHARARPLRLRGRCDAGAVADVSRGAGNGVRKAPRWQNSRPERSGPEGCSVGKRGALSRAPLSTEFPFILDNFGEPDLLQ